MLLYIALALPIFFLMRRILFKPRAPTGPAPVVSIASGRVAECGGRFFSVSENNCCQATYRGSCVAVRLAESFTVLMEFPTPNPQSVIADF